jgi:hypothetical protein
MKAKADIGALRRVAKKHGYAFTAAAGSNITATLTRGGSVQFKVDGCVRSAFDVAAFICAGGAKQ